MRSICLVALCGLMASWTLAAAGPSEPKRIADFSLRDYRGKTHSLNDLQGKKGTVVLFVGTECPLVKLYAPRVAAMARQFAPQGIAFVLINSNVQDTNTEIASFARTHSLDLPILKDPGNVVADQFGAERTPEAFLLDADGTIRYRGRIDDQYGVGYQRPAANRADLALAISQLLAGKAIEQPQSAAVGCLIGRVAKIEPTGTVTYSNQIARIFQNRCVRCHRPGEIGPFPLTSYEEAVGWGETILEVVRDRRMPPWGADPKFGHFRNDARMSDEETRLIREWVANGSPRGNPSDMPTPIVFPDGWSIPKPDQIIYASEKPISVPAEGVVDYMHLVVDPHFTEDKWVKACEVRPGNRAVLHHVIVFIQPPGGSDLPFGRELIGGYAPGMPPVVGYPGAAALVPKGSKFIFQMHYTPNGTATQDHSCFGLVFAKPEEVTTRMKAGMAANFLLQIPPNAENHEVMSKHRFAKDCVLYTLTPHMHLRGKSFLYELIYPDGKKEVLLDVPHFDFGWQLRYEFAEPKKVPKGSTLVCTAHFDNSPGNLSNPDPNANVRFGEQTWEEMMIGWFTSGTPKDTRRKGKSGS